MEPVVGFEPTTDGLQIVFKRPFLNLNKHFDKNLPTKALFLFMTVHYGFEKMRQWYHMVRYPMASPQLSPTTRSQHLCLAREAIDPNIILLGFEVAPRCGPDVNKPEQGEDTSHSPRNVFSFHGE